VVDLAEFLDEFFHGDFFLLVLPVLHYKGTGRQALL
jgi:hypothetical protein